MYDCMINLYNILDNGCKCKDDVFDANVKLMWLAATVNSKLQWHCALYSSQTNAICQCI